MPLLPGETNASDRYRSGLAPLEDAAESVKRWAASSQRSIEQAWRDLRESVAGGGQPQQDSLRMAGLPLTPHVVPFRGSAMDDPRIWRSLLQTAVQTAPAIMHIGDPLKACPATLLLMAGHTYVYGQTLPYRVWGFHYRAITEYGEMYRLISASFLHRDLLHIVNDMSNFFLQGLLLEKGQGWKFLAQTMAICVSTNVLRVVSAVGKGIPIGMFVVMPTFFYRLMTTFFLPPPLPLLSFHLPIDSAHPVPSLLSSSRRRCTPCLEVLARQSGSLAVSCRLSLHQVISSYDASSRYRLILELSGKEIAAAPPPILQLERHLHRRGAECLEGEGTGLEGEALLLPENRLLLSSLAPILLIPQPPPVNLTCWLLSALEDHVMVGSTPVHPLVLHLGCCFLPPFFCPDVASRDCGDDVVYDSFEMLTRVCELCEDMEWNLQ
eukprot:768272-Hanusia_phi.AAC.5